jgi:membrane protein YdbS with pleckstrin-like domain
MSNNLPFTLTNNEFLITELKRSKVPYVIMWSLALAVFSFFFYNFIQLYSANENAWFLDFSGLNLEDGMAFAPVFIFLCALTILFALVASHIYSANRMFVTNEHIVRIVQHGLVATDRKVITHLNIEDVKVSQNILGRILGYGKVTLSTEGQNATYQINYIKDCFQYETLITDTRDSYQQSVIDDGGKAIPFAEKR